MECNTLYHIYNHANGIEDLFKEEANYYFFIEKIKKYLFPVCKVYAYCLMPNHFHLFVETKDETNIELLPNARNYSSQGLYISKQFSNCFSSYTQAFNKRYKRRGSLFVKNFKRKPIQTESYLKNLIVYIHANPIEAGFCSQFDGWKFSSYLDIIANDKLLVKAEDVIEFYDSKKEFLQFHEQHRSSIEAFMPRIKV